MHRVFVTGGTGFVGRAVVHAVRADTHIVRCLVRRGSERDLDGFESIERVEGDVLAPETLEAVMAGCDTVIHLVGIIREHPARGITFERLHVTATRNVLEAAARTGVRRIVHMSALGARAGARSRYHQTKWRAEEAVRASGLQWTIFRPSIIYGRGDGFVTPLAKVVRRAPVVPVIGTGDTRLQPVPVEHVAEAFAQALGRGDELRDPLRWVWRVAFRVAAGELKDRRRRGTGEAEHSTEADDPGVELLDVLRRLSPRQRAALVLHYYAGYPTKEIAAILGSSAATVRVHLSQGRRRLRRILEDQRD